jgi:ABC-type bacteriocin/lantibiotic exporter with double-glycine peptidase domain
MLEVFFVLGAASLCAYVSFQIRAPGQAVAFLTTYVVAAYRVLPSINRITLSLLSIKGYQYTLDTVEEALFSETEQKAHVSESLNFERSISIESLSYKYPGREEETLNQVSFSIQKGECIGLVGPSGSGKTTLLNILLGFISPSSGGIRVDDTYLTPDRLDAWYRLIGYVQQEVFLLEGTLRENIAFGILKEDVDPSRLEVAIRRASLAQLVASIPGGMDAMIGERGANLSVGQKQRIGIARALYSGAQILIFDEATSALDAQTELEITESISSLSKEGFTIVIVAHRKSTLKHTHRIFELQKGNLQRETTYQELSTEV